MPDTGAMMAVYPIPEAALERHIGVLGKTGSGKSYLTRVIVERLLKNGGRVCVVDPGGVWWGLRLKADGKTPSGLDVVIFGGRHADLPLSKSHGDAIAEAVGTTTTPVIIDTSLMNVKERTQFFADFAEALFRKNRGPLHLIVDEAHLFAPQTKVQDPQSGMMLHATNNLVSLGRSRGLRIILISQRPAKLHKDSLTQVETLIAMRLIAPQDRAAVEDWLGEWADPKQGREIIAALPSLPTGTGFVWAPELNVLEKVSFPLIKTFDSMKPGAEEQSGELQPVDLTALRAKLSTVEAEVKANDPAALRRQIADLTRQLRDKPQAPPAAAADPAALKAEYDRGYYEGQQVTILEIGHDGLVNAEKVLAVAQSLRELGDALTKEARAKGQKKPAPPTAYQAPRPAVRPQPAPRRAERPVPSGSGEAMGAGERRLLIVAAQCSPDTCTRKKLALMSGYAVNGGSFRTYLSALRTKGYIADHAGGNVSITDAGIAALGDYEPLPTGRALLDHWLAELGAGPAKLLDAIARCYPNAISRAQAATDSGYELSGGSFRTYLSKLRTLELIDVQAGEIRASDDLF